MLLEKPEPHRTEEQTVKVRRLFYDFHERDFEYDDTVGTNRQQGNSRISQAVRQGIDCPLPALSREED